MIRISAVLAFLLAPIAAVAQTYPSPIFNNVTLQGSLTTTTSTPLSGSLITPSGGTSVAQGDNVASFDLVGGRANFLKQLLTTSTNSPVVYSNLANLNAANLATYGLYPQLGTASFNAQQQWDNTKCPLLEWGPSLPFAFGASIINNGQIYSAIVGGTSASSGTGPSGTGLVVDGGVTWQWLSTGQGCGQASLDAVIGTVYTWGQRPFQAQDVAVQAQVFKYGSDSTWAFDGQSLDQSGLPASAFSQVGMELDLGGSGPESVRTQYAPIGAYRVGLSINPNATFWGSWAASTAVSAPGVNSTGTNINATIAGTQYVLKVLTSGTTGGTVPSWPTPALITAGSVAAHVLTVTAVTGTINPGTDYLTGPGVPWAVKILSPQLSGTPGGAGTYSLSGPAFTIVAEAAPLWSSPPISDGTATWLIQQSELYEIGEAIRINGYGSTSTYIGTGLGTDADYYNAVIDMSSASLVTSVNPNVAGIRMGANMPIDFSGNGTAAGQNLRVLQYSTVAQALVYNGTISSTPTNFFEIMDGGGTVVQGLLRAANDSTLAR